jgi:hypothetical protein
VLVRERKITPTFDPLRCWRHSLISPGITIRTHEILEAPAVGGDCKQPAHHCSPSVLCFAVLLVQWYNREYRDDAHLHHHASGRLAEAPSTRGIATFLSRCLTLCRRKAVLWFLISFDRVVDSLVPFTRYKFTTFSRPAQSHVLSSPICSCRNNDNYLSFVILYFFFLSSVKHKQVSICLCHWWLACR